jgi:hypothetical protein
MNPWTPMRSLVLAMLIALLCISGCGAAREGAAAPAPAMDAKMSEAGPTLQVAADRQATTWKRSQIHANTARAHHYASDRNRASARTKVQALVLEDWRSSRERVPEQVVTLENGKDEHDIAVVWR